MFGGAIEAGKAFIKYFLDDAEVEPGLKKIGDQLTKVGAIGALATAPLIAGFAATAEVARRVGDALGDMSTRTGISASALSELSYASALSGTSIDTFERSIRKMQKGIVDAQAGTGQLKEALDVLKVSLADLAALPPEKQFEVLTDAISKVEDPTLKAALAQQVFGKSGAELLPLLNEGAKGIAALRAEAQKLGVTLTDEEVAALQAYDDALVKAKSQVSALGQQIGIAVAGPLTDWLASSEEIVAVAIEFIRQNQGLIEGLVITTGVIAGVSYGAIALGNTIRAVTTICGAASAVLKIYREAHIATAIATKATTAATIIFGRTITLVTRHPILAFLTLLAAGLVAVAGYFDWTSDEADDMAESLEKMQDKIPDPAKLKQTQLSAEASALQAKIEAAIAQPLTPSIAPAAASAEMMFAKELLDRIATNTLDTAKGIRELVHLATTGEAGFFASNG